MTAGLSTNVAHLIMSNTKYSNTNGCSKTVLLFVEIFNDEYIYIYDFFVSELRITITHVINVYSVVFVNHKRVLLMKASAVLIS